MCLLEFGNLLYGTTQQTLTFRHSTFRFRGTCSVCVCARICNFVRLSTVLVLHSGDNTNYACALSTLFTCALHIWTAVQHWAWTTNQFVTKSVEKRELIGNIVQHTQYRHRRRRTMCSLMARHIVLFVHTGEYSIYRIHITSTQWWRCCSFVWRRRRISFQIIDSINMNYSRRAAVTVTGRQMASGRWQIIEQEWSQ